jgi:hypothetical protein
MWRREGESEAIVGIFFQQWIADRGCAHSRNVVLSKARLNIRWTIYQLMPIAHSHW